MTVEIRPAGLRCNLECRYCYQDKERSGSRPVFPYDFHAVSSVVEGYGESFTLFGGEALLLPEEDLESLLAWGFQRFGGSGIQTNGARLSEDHIRMFKAYKVQVGLSMDGPGKLNDARWAGSLAETRRVTAHLERLIERLCGEGMAPGLIVTLHRGNATPEHLPVMGEWLTTLERLGVDSVRLHSLQVDSQEVRDTLALSDEEALEAMLFFLELERELPRMQLNPFREMRSMLRGKDESVSCVWRACDPLTTRSVQGVERDGSLSHCGRVNHEGIDYCSPSSVGYERYLALYRTPMEAGGCQGCRFFIVCKGHCPGSAVDKDWRNRTAQCRVLTGLLEALEGQLLDAGEKPVSLHPSREGIEEVLLGFWARGLNQSLSAIVQSLAGEPACTS